MSVLIYRNFYDKFRQQSLFEKLDQKRIKNILYFELKKILFYRMYLFLITTSIENIFIVIGMFFNFIF